MQGKSPGDRPRAMEIFKRGVEQAKLPASTRTQRSSGNPINITSIRVSQLRRALSDQSFPSGRLCAALIRVLARNAQQLSLNYNHPYKEGGSGVLVISRDGGQGGLFKCDEPLFCCIGSSDAASGGRSRAGKYFAIDILCINGYYKTHEWQLHQLQIFVSGNICHFNICHDAFGRIHTSMATYLINTLMAKTFSGARSSSSQQHHPTPLAQPGSLLYLLRFVVNYPLCCICSVRGRPSIVHVLSLNLSICACHLSCFSV